LITSLKSAGRNVQNSDAKAQVEREKDLALQAEREKYADALLTISLLQDYLHSVKTVTIKLKKEVREERRRRLRDLAVAEASSRQLNEEKEKDNELLRKSVVVAREDLEKVKLDLAVSQRQVEAERAKTLALKESSALKEKELATKYDKKVRELEDRLSNAAKMKADEPLPAPTQTKSSTSKKKGPQTTKFQSSRSTKSSRTTKRRP